MTARSLVLPSLFSLLAAGAMGGCGTNGKVSHPDGGYGGGAGTGEGDASAPVDGARGGDTGTDAGRGDASAQRDGAGDAGDAGAGDAVADAGDASSKRDADADAAVADGSSQRDAADDRAAPLDAASDGPATPDAVTTDAGVTDARATEPGATDAATSDGNLTDADASAPPVCIGFASQPSAWPLPAGSASSFPSTEFGQTTSCSSSAQFSWSTFDIDGDALPDLVVTQKCFDPTLGTTRWNVYKNTGGGFASTPIAWSLPAGSAASFPLKDLGEASGCDSSTQFSWFTFDIDGDALPDLVVTQKCFDPTLGTTRWNVYKNTGGGFASTPIAWNLPAGFAAGFPVKELAPTGCSSSAQLSWSTFDIDGDALPDLVVTQKCFDPTLGTTQWSVYKNTGGGFAATATTWSLPPGSAPSFPGKEATPTGCSSSTQFSWSTFDIDGDARPDLVVTQKCFDPALGISRWNVYQNTGAGFSSTATAWSLPPGSAPSFPGREAAPTGCSTSTQFSWSTFDIDGDARPDLVVTQKCFDAVLGKSAWYVYKGGPTGFAATPSCFGLPPAYPGITFTGLAASGCSSSAQYAWSTLDMNHDGKPDLLVTERCFDPALGVSQWNLHVNER